MVYFITQSPISKISWDIVQLRLFLGSVDPQTHVCLHFSFLISSLGVGAFQRFWGWALVGEWASYWRCCLLVCFGDLFPCCQVDVPGLPSQLHVCHRQLGQLHGQARGCARKVTEVQKYWNTGVQEYRITEVQKYRSTEVQKYRRHMCMSTEVQKYRSTEEHKYRSTEVQKYRSTEVQK